MSEDCLGDCCAACCGVCCIGCTQAMSNWSLFASCGSGSGTGGCCGGCCKRSFDDDDFAREEAKINGRREATQSQGRTSQAVSEQPAARPSMEMLQNPQERGEDEALGVEAS